MKLIISQNKVKQPVYKNLYKLVIDNMHGDADGTTYTEAFLRNNMNQF